MITRIYGKLLCRKNIFQYYYNSKFNSSIYACIIGSGPAGFYCAQHLMKLLPKVSIDMYEKMPVPFGLVRFGIAPDHQEMKNVTNTFTKIATNPRVRFIGNVTLGKHITLEQLRNSYHVVILSYGADEDIKLGIQGENLKSVISARQFVAWYNGMPNAVNYSDYIDLQKSDKAIIIGQGNVAIDVARMLLKSVDELRKTDITEYSLNKLSNSKIKHVYIIGRRGPLQAAYTLKEFREMTNLKNVLTVFDHKQLAGLNISDLARPRKRLTEYMIKISDNQQNNNESFHHKSFNVVFFRSPLSINGTESVDNVEFSINELVEDSIQFTKQREVLKCGLFIRSIGYKSISVDPEIKINESGKINEETLPENVYSTGWLSTGPVGVILTTMSNAFQTAEIIAKHISSGQICTETKKPGFEEVQRIFQTSNCYPVFWEGWEKIDKVEIQRGQLIGKPREKIVDIEEMLEIAGS